MWRGMLHRERERESEREGGEGEVNTLTHLFESTWLLLYVSCLSLVPLSLILTNVLLPP